MAISEEVTKKTDLQIPQNDYFTLKGEKNDKGCLDYNYKENRENKRRKNIHYQLLCFSLSNSILNI